MLLRLAYLGVTNALAMFRLLPMSDRAKDVEILTLRHQIMILERQLNGQRIRFTPADRALLAAPLHRLPRAASLRVRLLVRPETLLRWHRDLIAARHARIPAQSVSAGRGRRGRSACWCYVWRRRTAPGNTAASTVNCSSWASRSLHPLSGRSSTRPVSTRHLNGLRRLDNVPTISSRGDHRR
jgi:hypothetical protein